MSCGLLAVARGFKGARSGLDAELTANLLAYCEANDKLPTKVIKTAVREYLARKMPRPKTTAKGARRGRST